VEISHHSITVPAAEHADGVVVDVAIEESHGAARAQRRPVWWPVATVARRRASVMSLALMVTRFRLWKYDAMGAVFGALLFRRWIIR
jgi:hypothetical protein